MKEQVTEMIQEINEEVWKTLREEAIAAMETAYCPYSKYPVGAAALVDDGRMVSGCNVENAAYGVSLCAECGMISDLVRSGGGRIVAFICVDGRGQPTSPCGRCRQLLWEHGGPDLVLEMPQGQMTMREVLPGGFGLEDLELVWEAPRNNAPTAKENQ